jgi:hypothetical protein
MSRFATKGAKRLSRAAMALATLGSCWLAAGAPRYAGY